MTAANIPYHLRTQKAVDRRLFLDLLGRFERYKPIVRYAYLSMGAYPLEDHKLVHRLLGITRLICFDGDERIVARQKFNRPTNTCYCACMKSSELVSSLDEVLTDAEAADADGLIVWLDYTSPKHIGEQIREFQELIDKLASGDIVRITVNANPAALGDDSGDNGKRLVKQELAEKRFKKLDGRIGDYLPNDVTLHDMSKEKLPIALARAFGNAAGKALPPSGSKTFMPVSIVRYADAQQMLTLTGVVTERNEKSIIWDKVSLSDWPFSSREWNQVHALSVPDLTLRERLLLDRAVADNSHSKLEEDLGFRFEDDIDAAAFIQNYKDFYRFYPSLLTAEL